MGFLDRFRKKPAPPQPRPVGRRSVFAGAQQGRLFEDWLASWMSAKDELRWELRLLRTRSREQCRNNPLARRYLGLVDENILGPAGITLQCRNRLPSGEPDEETNQQIEAAWSEWGARATCTADGRLTWREFQGAVLEAVARDGEALVELLPGFPNAFGFAVRLLDIDLLDEEYNVPARSMNGGGSIVQGVELDRWGKPVAYHVWTRHPQEMLSLGQRERVRMPAGRVLHLGRQRRAGQVRYEPWLTPVLVPLRMLDEYLNAELAAARAGAENLGFIQKSIDASGPDPNDPTAGARTFESARGAIQELAPGETFAAWGNNHPNAVLPSFVREIKAQVANGLNVAYASLTGDMSQSNYSSSRLALNGERDHWQIAQRWLAEALCEPVFLAFLRQAVIWQQVRLPGPVSAYSWTEWAPRGFEYVDPEKDIAADLSEVAAGLNSLTRIAAKRGLDFRTLMLERRAEIALAAEMGVPLQVGNAPAAPAPAAPAEDAMDAEDTTEPEDDAAEGEDMADTGDAADADAEDPAPERQIIVNVTTPPVNVTVERQGPETVTVAPAQVHVAPAEVSVTVEGAKPGKRTVRHVRDAAGKIVASEVEEVPNG